MAAVTTKDQERQAVEKIRKSWNLSKSCGHWQNAASAEKRKAHRRSWIS